MLGDGLCVIRRINVTIKCMVPYGWETRCTVPSKFFQELNAEVCSKDSMSYNPLNFKSLIFFLTETL